MNSNTQIFTKAVVSVFDTNLVTPEAGAPNAVAPVLWITKPGTVEVKPFNGGGASVSFDIKAGDTMIPLRVTEIVTGAGTTLIAADIICLY